LQARGYSAEGLHGEHKQNVRDRIMAKFRSRTVEILVATDVASRGIDVKDVEMVVNYDLPKDTEDYVHRIGRTGRAGKKGLALSFASGRDLFRLRNIESFSKTKIPRRAVPTLDQVETAQHTILLDKIREIISAGGLDRYSVLVDTLVEGDITASDVASALLKLTLPEAIVPQDESFQKERGFEGAGNFSPDRKFNKEKRFEGGDEKPAFKRGNKESRTFDTDGASAKLFLNVGRMQGVLPKDILGALAGETGIPGKSFGNINVQSKHTVVDVPEDKFDAIVEAFKKVRIKGVPVKARRFET
jgi:ATP-dependent RNA helicase DeaD